MTYKQVIEELRKIYFCLPGRPDTRACMAILQLIRDLEADVGADIDPLMIVEDGFGSVWGPCRECGSKMEVVRPGKAQCPKCG